MCGHPSFCFQLGAHPLPPLHLESSGEGRCNFPTHCRDLRENWEEGRGHLEMVGEGAWGFFPVNLYRLAAMPGFQLGPPWSWRFQTPSLSGSLCSWWSLPFPPTASPQLLPPCHTPPSALLRLLPSVLGPGLSLPEPLLSWSLWVPPLLSFPWGHCGRSSCHVPQSLPPLWGMGGGAAERISCCSVWECRMRAGSRMLMCVA